MKKALITADLRVITDQYYKEEISYSKMLELINKKADEFAEFHIKKTLKKVVENVSLKESSSEEVNANNIYPFITANDNSIWIVDRDSILNSSSLRNSAQKE